MGQIHPPTHPLTNPPTHPLTHPLTNPQIHPLTHPLTNPPIHPLTNPPTHPLTHPLTNPPTHPLTNPQIHPPTNPPTHPLGPLPPPHQETALLCGTHVPAQWMAGWVLPPSPCSQFSSQASWPSYCKHYSISRYQ